MIAELNIWQLLAGLGIFLLGMSLIEHALEQLAGRAFKRFLRNFTNHPIKAIFAGVVVTALCRAAAGEPHGGGLVGAGIIELRSAIGIILGANLGTTFTGWIVATLGFSLQAEVLALPLIAVGGLISAYGGKRTNLLETGRLLLGFGFMFYGLSFMKISVAGWAEQFDISPFAGWSPFLLAPIGFALAALIQSSTAAMVIALSALSAGVLTLEGAAAMAIGSDLGTTMTALLGGFGVTGQNEWPSATFFSTWWLTCWRWQAFIPCSIW
ncbi:MAG: Na/Pi cotransporter family protein [Saprospiraceae bacterium]|nr:Na/Pi cotransporter family protein [Saprospiraceae bacterium]